MKAGFTFKSLAVWFVIVLVSYGVVFYSVEYLNHRKGPWEVNFMSDAQGNPAIVTYQPKLDISSVEIIFPGETIPQTNLSQRVIFDRPLRQVPFGSVISTGYVKNYNYDNRLKYLLPPYMFDSTTAGWHISRETLCTPGGSDPNTAC